MDTVCLWYAEHGRVALSEPAGLHGRYLGVRRDVVTLDVFRVVPQKHDGPSLLLIQPWQAVGYYLGIITYRAYTKVGWEGGKEIA